MEKQFSSTGVISKACDLFNQNWLILIVMMLISGVGGSILSSIGSAMGSVTLNPAVLQSNDLQAIALEMANYLPYTSIGLCLTCVFSVVMEAALMGMNLCITAGQKADFTAFKMPAERYLYFFLATLLSGVIVLIGTMFCLVPGIYLAVRLAFVQYYTIDRGMSPVEALRASWQDTEGNWWHLFGAMLLIALFALCGYLVCCVGVLYTAPAASIATALLYRAICTDSAEEEATVGRVGEYDKQG